MSSITRLFDFLTHQYNTMPKQDMLCQKENGEWRKWSTQEVLDTAQQLSAGLIKSGLGNEHNDAEKKDKIAVISRNCPEWLILDIACQQAGIILCPIYPTTHPDEIRFIFNDACIKCVFVSGADLLEKIKNIQQDTPDLQGIFTFDEIEGYSYHWRSLLEGITKEDVNEIQKKSENINPEECATIIYTSGTTGTPKGVMLSHRNIVSNVLNATASFPFPSMPHASALSFLPLNHIFERVASYIYMYAGISIYYAESMDTIGDNLREVKPTLFTTVPRLLEKVYEKIMSKAGELPGWKKQLFFWAVNLGKRFDNIHSGGIWYKLQLQIARKLVFKKWREALGGNVQYVITGGAACPVYLLRIFSAAGIPVYEGYGPTENSPVISVNCAKKGGTKFGTTGLVIQGQEVKLLEDGEICVKGPSVMMGYYKRPDLTADVIIDGWLCTGDIGRFNEYGHLIITDRKKELFKTSGGKYVAPQAVENKLKESPLIEQAMSVGDGKKFVSALIIPNLDYLQKKLLQQGVNASSQTNLIHHPESSVLIQKAVDKANAGLNPVEQVKKFVLLEKPWTIEAGELTPKMSLKRKNILEKHQKQIDSMYLD